MGYEGYSLVEASDTYQDKIRETVVKQEQLEELEQAIQSRLESAIENFISDLQEQNNLSDIEEAIVELKKRLEADAEGKARDAITEKMEKHLNKLSNTDDTWEAHMNNFHVASWITRLFR